MLTEAKSRDILASRINSSKYSNYIKLIRVTARVLSMFQKDEKLSFRNAAKILMPKDITQGERFSILEAQNSIRQDLKNGRLRCLCPKIQSDGVTVVGGRVERWVEMSYNQHEVPLLPKMDDISCLYTKYVHKQGHYGVSATASRVRSRFWIVGLHRITKSIKYNCVVC